MRCRSAVLGTPARQSKNTPASVRLDRGGDHRHGRSFRSMEGDKIEAVPGDHRRRCRDVIDHHKKRPVGAEDHKGLLAIARGGLEVHRLARAKMPQLLGGDMTQRGDFLIAGGSVSPGLPIGCMFMTADPPPVRLIRVWPPARLKPQMASEPPARPANPAAAIYAPIVPAPCLIGPGWRPRCHHAVSRATVCWLFVTEPFLTVARAGSVTHLFDLTGRTAVVTGSAQGMGRAMAIALAEAGANLVLLDRTRWHRGDGAQPQGVAARRRRDRNRPHRPGVRHRGPRVRVGGHPGQRGWRGPGRAGRGYDAGRYPFRARANHHRRVS
jgi:hypothetical protein